MSDLNLWRMLWTLNTYDVAIYVHSTVRSQKSPNHLPCNPHYHPEHFLSSRMSFSAISVVVPLFLPIFHFVTRLCPPPPIHLPSSRDGDFPISLEAYLRTSNRFVRSCRMPECRIEMAGNTGQNKNNRWKRHRRLTEMGR